MGNKERHATTLVQQYILTFPDKGLGVLHPTQHYINPHHDKSGQKVVMIQQAVRSREAKVAQAMAAKQDTVVTLEELAQLVVRPRRPSLLADTAYHQFLAPQTQATILATASKLGLVDDAATLRIPTGSWTPTHVKNGGKKTKDKVLQAPRKTATRSAALQPSL